MGIINTKSIKYLHEQAGQIKRLLGPRPNFTNITDLQYMPKQLATDVLVKSSEAMQSGITRERLEALINSGKTQTQIAQELNMTGSGVVYHLKKLGIYKPTKIAATPEIIIERDVLQALIDNKKSMAEIATELNVSPGKVRYYLDKYEIRNSDLEELEILRKYISATTQKDKTEAYAVIDKYLEQIAKEKYQEGCAISYQDFLQDIRLQFFELAEKRENNINSSVRNLFRRIRDLDFTKTVEHKTEDLTSVLDKADDMDISIENFENAGFFKFLLKNSDLKEREKYIIDAYTEQNRSLVDIADNLGLEPQRVRKILNDAIEKLDKSRKFFSSENYHASKANRAQLFVNEIVKRNEDSRNIKVDKIFDYNY